jgi:CRP-like cAMP-binding protein
MLTDAKRMSFLRSVSIFRDTPPDVLSDLASLLSEVKFAADQMIFKKGDYGDSMFIIVDGKVKVHDGELLYNYLGISDVFGEMSASIEVSASSRQLRIRAYSS